MDGDLFYEPYWPDFDGDPDGWEESEWCGPSRGPSFKTCDHCGKSGFIWKETENGWRLATVNGALHKCGIPKSVLKAFEDLP